jgi:cyclopropane-fatty-acyl-phospholipid synthase
VNSYEATAERSRLTPSEWTARAILKLTARRVPVELVLPDGERLGRQASGCEPLPRIEILDPAAIYRRLAANPKIGIGESYMAGEWRPAPGIDLADALMPFAERFTTALPAPLRKLHWIVDRPIPSADRNSPTGSRRNIEAHYDLSNDLFEAFLDETMSYSSALFDASVPTAAQTLEAAQIRKIDRILDRAGVTDGRSMLEIGTGWGALAIRAAQRGAHVTTITLSQEQAALAAERATSSGVDDRIEIVLRDYREIEGRFDAIVSVEMLEAVGEEFWPAYFSAIDRLLAPGGRAALQTILMSHERLLATRSSYGWIQKHIFPGGLIPSQRAIAEVVERHTSLQLDEAHRFGPDYAETLRRWRSRFIEQWPSVAAGGFDTEFRRKWEFYLAYCEAGFGSGYLDVAQLSFSKPAMP